MIDYTSHLVGWRGASEADDVAVVVLDVKWLCWTSIFVRKSNGEHKRRAVRFVSNVGPINLFFGWVLNENSLKSLEICACDSSSGHGQSKVTLNKGHCSEMDKDK